MRLKIYRPWIAGVCAVVAFLATPPARAALDRDTRTLVRASGYGLLAGTAAGLFMWPLSGQLRTVFLGSSLGLYVGIVVGVYQIVQAQDSGGSGDSTGYLPAAGTEALQVGSGALYPAGAWAGCLGHSEDRLQDAVQARMAYLSVTEPGIRVPILHF